jgi:uncharacterized protein with ATP-grasp and redox domains
MEPFLDCLPCTLRQALEACRMVTDRPELQEKIMKESIKILSDFTKYRSSPSMGGVVHKAVKRITGVNDPYRDIKRNDIAAAKKVYPLLESFLTKKQNELYWALKIAATGNIIDSAVNNNLNLEECLENELEKKFSICDLDVLKNKLKTAKSLLIIGDNAGETVFDCILAKNLCRLDITYAVKSEPILNDATAFDAYASGLGEYARIVPSGSSVPGTILEECSDEFLELFNTADIVISKGQGNFETLPEHNDNLFFLLKAKCPVISRRLGAGLNEYVFKYSASSPDSSVGK